MIRREDTMLAERPHRWASWLLGIGPIVRARRDEPIMICNPRHAAAYRLGNRDHNESLRRGDGRAITSADMGDGWTDIAVAAAAIESTDDIPLPYSIADEQLQPVDLRLFRWETRET